MACREKRKMEQGRITAEEYRRRTHPTPQEKGASAAHTVAGHFQFWALQPFPGALERRSLLATAEEIVAEFDGLFERFQAIGSLHAQHMLSTGRDEPVKAAWDAWVQSNGYMEVARSILNIRPGGAVPFPATSCYSWQACLTSPGLKHKRHVPGAGYSNEEIRAAEDGFGSVEEACAARALRGPSAAATDSESEDAADDEPAATWAAEAAPHAPQRPLHEGGAVEQVRPGCFRTSGVQYRIQN